MYWFEYNPQEAELARYEEGVEVGMKRANLETVKRMMQAGLSINMIEIATGLTEEQIRAAVEHGAEV